MAATQQRKAASPLPKMESFARFLSYDRDEQEVIAGLSRVDVDAKRAVAAYAPPPSALGHFKRGDINHAILPDYVGAMLENVRPGLQARITSTRSRSSFNSLRSSIPIANWY